MNANQNENPMPPITKEILYDLVDMLVSASAYAGGGIRSGGGEAWLNPQPLPPMPATELRQPDLWRSAAVARQVISMAAVSQAATDEETGLHRARSILGVFLDDFCGTGPSRRFPLPPPWPRSGIKPTAVDLLVAAAQFQAVANTLKGHPMAESLAHGADRLLEVGLQR